MVEMGVRVGLSFKHQIELISLTKPPTDQMPPHLAGLAGKIGDSEDAVIVAVSFKVPDADAAIAELEGNGVGIIGRMAEDKISNQGIVGLDEFFLKAEDALGLGITIAKFDWAKAD